MSPSFKDKFENPSFHPLIGIHILRLDNQSIRLKNLLRQTLDLLLYCDNSIWWKKYEDISDNLFGISLPKPYCLSLKIERRHGWWHLLQPSSNKTVVDESIGLLILILRKKMYDSYNSRRVKSYQIGLSSMHRNVKGQASFFIVLNDSTKGDLRIWLQHSWFTYHHTCKVILVSWFQ